MALGKQLTNIRTGHSNEYWRVDTIGIDRPRARLEIVLAGYADSGTAAASRQPDDRRDWTLGGPAFVALAGRTLYTDLKSAGYDVDSWPAEVRAVLAAETTNNTIARGCYETIRATRRPMPIGATLDQETGDVTLPTGEAVPAESVEEGEQGPTIPSEFADALDV